MRLNFEVEQLEYHRNGVTGAGFYVGTGTLKDRGLPERKMVVIRFPDCDKAAGGVVCAAFDLEKLAKGDIEFASNSWRGDNFAPAMDRAIKRLTGKDA